MSQANSTGDRQQSKVCPHCGYCKECGRGPNYWPYQVGYPYITWAWPNASSAGIGAGGAYPLSFPTTIVAGNGNYGGGC